MSDPVKDPSDNHRIDLIFGGANIPLDLNWFVKTIPLNEAFYLNTILALRLEAEWNAAGTKVERK